ncbi:hypothetical protein BDV23DRAFT_152219 [Aspergillus alliaceus]|uniref:Uncharacterized protein n=1 Tax=Petromyces alliaceus TaxID=209559 RepID=A0A5N7CCJ8_PETAA|nr:hypothetical protein BDV23DRAFT_152219 [Aspergillus alliaceus]
MWEANKRLTHFGPGTYFSIEFSRGWFLSVNIAMCLCSFGIEAVHIHYLFGNCAVTL